jgi:uncharacterized protein YcnI
MVIGRHLGLVIRTVGVAAAVALTLPSLAAAHVTVSPTHTEPGERTLIFTVPNERFDPEHPAGIDRVTITTPRGVGIGQTQAKPGWKTSQRGRTVSWSGGSIGYGRYDTFGIEVEVPGGSEQLRFAATERFGSQPSRVERFPVVVVAPPRTSSGAHGLAVAALVVAVGASVIAAAGLFVGLAHWLRGT